MANCFNGCLHTLPPKRSGEVRRDTNARARMHTLSTRVRGTCIYVLRQNSVGENAMLPHPMCIGPPPCPRYHSRSRSRPARALALISLFSRSCPQPKAVARCCATCIVRFPCCVIAVSLVVTLAFTIVGFRMLGTDGLMPSSIGSYPNKAIEATRTDALRLARSDSAKVRFALGGEAAEPKERSRGPFGRRLETVPSYYLSSQSTQSETMEKASTYFYFSGRNGDALTPEGLNEMCYLHNKILSNQYMHDKAGPMPGNYSSFCRVEKVGGNWRCDATLTPLQIFYGSANYDIDDINVDDLTLDNFDAIASVRPLSACLPPSPKPRASSRRGRARANRCVRAMVNAVAGSQQDCPSQRELPTRGCSEGGELRRETVELGIWRVA